MSPKVHFRLNRYSFPVCGTFHIYYVPGTNRWARVTCKHCLRTKPK
jgi:hypothetical protein